MTRHVDRQFQDLDVVLDGNEFQNCRFDRCRLIYRGGELLTMADCHFSECRFVLEEAAARTMEFLRGMYHGMDGGQEVVEQMFFSIRRKPRKEPADADVRPAK